MLGESKLEGRAVTLFTFHGHPSAVSLDKCLNDSETETQATFILRISFEFIEHFFKVVFRDAGTVVADRTFDGAVKLTRLNVDLSARSELDCVGDQVLKDPPQQAGICIKDQVVRDFIDELGAARSSHWTKIMDESLDERPQVKFAPLEFDAGFCSEINVFLDDLVDQPLQMLDVTAEGF